MPVLTFKDIIVLVKNVFFCVAKAKIRTLDGGFYIVLLGTDRLESTFNADILTLTFRLSHAIECLNIFLEHPDWDCGTHRLNLCGIEDGNGNIVSKADHITPTSWEGNVELSKILPIPAWNSGRQMVDCEFRSSRIEEALIELEKKGYDMTYPFGQCAETTILDSDDDEETKHSLSEPLSVEAAVEMLAAIVFEGPVSRLPKDRDWTGPRPD